MSIDWAKAEARPDKKLSIEGKVLLDLRSKINSLEKQLAQKIKDLEKSSGDLKTTKETLSETKKKDENLEESINSLKKNFERVKEEKLYAEAEINKLKSAKQALESKLNESSSKISEVENELKEKEDIKADLQQKINEIESLKSDLQKAVSDKYVEVETIKEERDAKLKEVKELNEKVTLLEQTIGEAKGAPQLIENIKDIMIHKGFLSDREFDDLLEKKEI